MGWRTSRDCRSSRYRQAWSRSTAAHRMDDSGYLPPRTQEGEGSSHRRDSAEAQASQRHNPSRAQTASKQESWSSVLTDSLKALDSEAVDGAATRRLGGAGVAEVSAQLRLRRRRWATTTTPENYQREGCEYYSRHASRRGANSSPMCSIHSAAQPLRRKQDGQASRIR